MRITLFLFSMLLFFSSSIAWAEEPVHPELAQPIINLKDKASLQRGAATYMNYCAGCHSLKYLTYSRMAGDIGMVQANGKLAKDIVQRNLIFNDSGLSDPIVTALKPRDAKQFFGIVPPDLTLEVRVRGAAWIYNYLLNFYSDPSKTWGVNNLIFPDVAMPNVLVNLQGVQVPVWEGQGDARHIAYLLQASPGRMEPLQFDKTVSDLVNFLTYAAEPEKLFRERLGIYVLGFLLIFTILAFFLKKAFWRNIQH